MNSSPQTCRACGAILEYSFADLGLSPISNAFIKPENIYHGEMFYPLHALVCHRCWLVQLAGVTQAESHFHDDYVYFSSFSASWLDHARQYAGMVRRRFNIGATSRVMEIASNDGYLLQYFTQAGIPCLGIEPSANTAAAARKKGVESREVFFSSSIGEQLSTEGWKVDLLIANNVLAHVPDINDFMMGMQIVLKAHGVITLEFPHLLKLIEQNQFDTIYHEHYSYLSLTALMPILERSGLRCFDVEYLSTHGGSLRLYACHINGAHAEKVSVEACINEEENAGLTRIDTYVNFRDKVRETKRMLLEFIIAAKEDNKRIAAYGAAAKGNTLLNYCGIGTDFIDYVVDKNPIKQNRFLPGSRIPVFEPKHIFDFHPDYLIILPWNLKYEVIKQMDEIRDWGAKFVVPIPKLEVIG